MEFAATSVDSRMTMSLEIAVESLENAWAGMVLVVWKFDLPVGMNSGIGATGTDDSTASPVNSKILCWRQA